MGDASATPDAAVSRTLVDARRMQPPAADGTFHSFSAATFEDNTITTSMCDYRGNVVMVVNVAALCGYAAIRSLQDLQDRYGASGFSVLGFLSDDFRMQAGSKDEIEECATRFGLTFPQSTSSASYPILLVVSILFRWITSQEGLEGDISWNFNKFLVNGTAISARWNET